MPIFSIKGQKPFLPESGNVWVAPDSNLIGQVILNNFVSVWFNSTLRGDNDLIVVGEGSNIQENCVLHTDTGFPLHIGENCTIGHKAILHGCKIGSGSLIGMGSIILNGANIGKNCLIGAGSLVPEGMEIADGTLHLGSPSRFKRNLSEGEKKNLILTAKQYQKNMASYKTSLKKIAN